ncbi:hypothetical protein EI534_03135 [Pseudomonas frederiksbergensis]|nr:hypothetical protein [Pseudomonas frederiksbergensis]
MAGRFVVFFRAFVARGLAPVGSRSGPTIFRAAAQPNGGKPPRHRVSGGVTHHVHMRNPGFQEFLTDHAEAQTLIERRGLHLRA